MDIAAHLLQALFVLNAEMLFLVDNQQAEVLEIHALGQQGMRADTDIDRPVGQTLARVGGLFLRHEPRQLPHLQRKTTEPVLKRLGVLARKQGCRRDHRHLHPCHRRHERGTHRNLGLAKTHIAADQTVHRRA